MDSAEYIPPSPMKTEVFSLLLFIPQNDNNVDLIPCVKYNFASYTKSRNFKNFTNSEKNFCDFILRFINGNFFGDNIKQERKRDFHDVSSTISGSSSSSKITSSAFSNSSSISSSSAKLKKSSTKS